VMMLLVAGVIRPPAETARPHAGWVPALLAGVCAELCSGIPARLGSIGSSCCSGGTRLASRVG